MLSLIGIFYTSDSTLSAGIGTCCHCFLLCVFSVSYYHWYYYASYINQDLY